MSKINNLLEKALNLEFLTFDEGVKLFFEAELSHLMFVSNTLRYKHNCNKVVTWIIDRNLNTTNICIANCKFCNFYRTPGSIDGYITTMDEYRIKIKETINLGGDQLLLQGGHHPDLGLEYYENLFKNIKAEFPYIKLHALGPPEIVHIAKLANLSFSEVLKRLIAAGLDSLPGAGAEILDDRVRRLISNGKCKSKEWLDVMREAHKLNIVTSATMMFGHVETVQERIKHLILLREVQNEKPKDSVGFIAFIPWPFQDKGTLLQRVKGINNKISKEEYVRMIAISRIMLPNINNIQASWLTVGKDTAQVCLHAGANDFGSIMIEENVVSAAGASHRFTSASIQKAIKEAGFEPKLRTQEYKYRELPSMVYGDI
ncbi:MAG: cyclic dehypoxanthinyl futalosine synthase [Solitalea-like symbiont of Tyrophagus putrescentiae]